MVQAYLAGYELLLAEVVSDVHRTDKELKKQRPVLLMTYKKRGFELMAKEYIGNDIDILLTSS